MRRLFNPASLTFGCVKTHKAAAKAFGPVMEKYRERKGLTKQELAYESELSLSNLKRIEYGQVSASLDTIFIIAKALQVPAYKLIKEAEQRMQSHENVK